MDNIYQVTELTEEARTGVASGSLIGNFNISYNQLKKAFGKPLNLFFDKYKSDAEWIIYTPKGYITIYNYKDGKNYCGRKEGLPVSKITDWNFGGKNLEAFYLVESYLLSKI